VKPTLVVHGVDMPTIGAVNEGLRVQAHIQNIGSDVLQETLELCHDGRVLGSRQVRLDPGESDTVKMTVSFSGPGHYTVTAGLLSKSVSVNPIWIDDNNNGLIDGNERSFVHFGEALEAAKAGDVILVNPGHFHVDAEALPLVVDVPDLTIRSVEGYEKTIIEAVDANEEAYEGHALFSVTADGAVIEGFTLKLGVYNVYVHKAKDVQIRKNFFNMSRRYHIYMVDAFNVTIAENRSRVGRYNFLTASNCTGCLVEGNYHYEDPCGYMLRDSDRNTIKRNHFDSLSWYGVSLDNSSNNLVENNLFEGSRICGLQMRGTSVGNRIIRNTFVDNRTEAVLITGGSRDNEVHQNNITGNRGLAVTNETPYRLDAVKNWWGSEGGPAGAGPGSGDTVDKNVEVDSWLKSPVGNSWPALRNKK
jgi:parallel beta-helix repeat protein